MLRIIEASGGPSLVSISIQDGFIDQAERIRRMEQLAMRGAAWNSGSANWQGAA
jgi:hypothetical protein